MSNNAGVNDLEPFVQTLANFKREDLAVEILEEFGKRAVHFEQYDNLAKCFFKLRHYDKAAVFGEKSLSVASNSPQYYSARFNLINVYNHANYPEKAMRYIKQCEAVIPEDVDVVLEKAYSHFLLNQKDKAEAILQETLVKYPDLPEEVKTKIKFNLGTYYLYRDEFQIGLRLFLEEGAKMKFWNTESIFARNNNLQFETLNQKLRAQKFVKWDGVPRPGMPVIVHAEAGIGDEIINFRFMKKIKESGMIPYWYNSYGERKDLLAMFRRHGYNTIHSLNEVEGDTVYYAQSMHLPIVMGLEYKDLWDGPYLQADSKFTESWKWVKKDKPAVGIRWQGNPAYDHDLHRSYPLKQVLDLFDGKDIDLYSLQKDNGLEEMDSRITDLSTILNSWEDTLACMENLDVIITSCTSVAHAAAALGKKVIVMVPISAYYIWSHSGDKSPWYGDNVILLRQQKPRTWDEPVKELEKLIPTLL